MTAADFELFKTAFMNVVDYIVMGFRYGFISARDVSRFITGSPLLFLCVSFLLVGLGIGLLRRLKSL